MKKKYISETFLRDAKEYDLKMFVRKKATQVLKQVILLQLIRNLM